MFHEDIPRVSRNAVRSARGYRQSQRNDRRPTQKAGVDVRNSLRVKMSGEEANGVKVAHKRNGISWRFPSKHQCQTE
jgi:hypothetical protein